MNGDSIATNFFEAIANQMRHSSLIIDAEMVQLLPMSSDRNDRNQLIRNCLQAQK